MRTVISAIRKKGLSRDPREDGKPAGGSMRLFLWARKATKNAECVRRAKQRELSKSHDKHDDRSGWRGFCFRVGR